MVIYLKSNFENHCKIKGNKNSEYDVYFLHGFTRSNNDQDIIANFFKKDYTVIECDARGHGKNKEGRKEDWLQTIEDYEKLMEKRNKPSILIGHSMGATEALSLFARNKSKTIKQAFVVAGVNGKSIIGSPEKKEKFKKIYDYESDDMNQIKNLLAALPENFANCNSRSKDIYLIHSKKDELVLFDQFEKNKKDFCVPNDNILVYNDLPIDDHSIIFYIPKTINFIKDRIQK
jgi:esterase/lipase